jgi:hypothetical protein
MRVVLASEEVIDSDVVFLSRQCCKAPTRARSVAPVSNPAMSSDPAVAAHSLFELVFPFEFFREIMNELIALP